MLQRDFFAFCTTLKPADLKLIGTLSKVQHLENGYVLFSPGDPAETLYIINRGVLEILPPNSRENSKGILLERGDIVGETEVFNHTPRTQLVRAHGASTVQCFPRESFPELLRRIPSFYYYLCEQMAHRLRKERDLANKHNNLMELSGQLSNFDLTTVYQAIMSSSQTGELTIRDDTGQSIGAFYFASGHLRAGQFRHLSGEEAFWQLFLNDNSSGSFLFAAEEETSTSSWIESGKIDRNGTELLLTGLQFRDEFDEFRKATKQTSGKLRARAKHLHWENDMPEELKATATQIWQLLSSGPRTIDDLYRHCSVCELKIYRTVIDLHRTRQISFIVPNDRPSGIPERALEPATAA